MSNEEPRLLGTGPLAEELGVDRGTITTWVSRYPPGCNHPFPKADAEIDTGKTIVRGWKPERVPEIQRWMASRREPEMERFVAELERLDREQPGAVRRMYEDSSALFGLLTNSHKTALLNYLDQKEEA